MRSETPCDVSVVIPFTDDEERVGALTRRVAEHLGALGMRFEILAVDEDSRDNSVALLTLLREAVPQLRVLAAAADAGFDAGARVARGRTLLLLHVDRAQASLAPFSRAHRHVVSGESDVVVLRGRFLLCRRVRAWQVLDGARGRGAVYERRVLRRAAARRLRVELPTDGPPLRATSFTWTRLLHGIAPALRRSRA
jgi:glycosyl transferase family 2